MSRPNGRAEPAPPDGDRLATLRASLLDHYDRNARALPWRERSDPYAVWVSEVMLQQTRVETVLRYYGPWLERFPDLRSLADAERDEVLRAWEGLGYYRRARLLHEAARVVRDVHAGRLPSDYEALRGLPGLGEYTAGAVASIAFGERVPAVDGNVRRVLARLFDVAEPRPAWLRRTAAALVDPDRPGDWNQALMELGATICTPRSPGCGACPVSGACAARAAGTQGERPAPGRRPTVEARDFAAAVAVDRSGRALLVRRPEEGLLGGMWGFPDAKVGGADEATAGARGALAGVGVDPEIGGGGSPRILAPVRHRFTHIDATYHPVLLPVRHAAGGRGGRARWVDLADPDVAIPVAHRKIARAARAALEQPPLGLEAAHDT